MIVKAKEYWAMVSGGKDSFLMLLTILSNPGRYPLTGVMHAELEIDWPFIKDVVDFMEELCKQRGIPFLRIRPRKTWEELYNKPRAGGHRSGFPTAKCRWCLRDYKLDAMRQLNAIVKDRGGQVVNYIGYCYDEVRRYEGRTGEIYPLVEKKIIERDVLAWARNQPMYGDYYKLHKRCGCMYCPMTSLRELAYMAKFYPDNYKYMMDRIAETEEEVSIRLGRPFTVRSLSAAATNEKVMKVYVPMISRELSWLSGTSGLLRRRE